MTKVFNTTGACSPAKHYMIDLTSRLSEIKKLVDNGDYFAINRARQYGKTTTLRMLKTHLQPDYAVIFMSFQKMSSAKFQDEYIFSRAFAKEFVKKAETEHGKLNPAAVEKLKKQSCQGEASFDLTELFELLSDICGASAKPVLLMIDEVDQASNNQVFLDFLGRLREYYLNREETPGFYSVILAGVYDIKNLKIKLRPDGEHRYNSPWNIAVPFSLNMSFLPADIETMLLEYEKDHRTGMEIYTMAKEIYEITGGYPYLVSCLCKKLDESGAEWNRTNLQLAVRDFLKEPNPLFEDVIKNLQNHPGFSKLAEQLLLHGANIVFEPSNPAIGLGSMFGILKEKDGKTMVSNIIFETLMLNYFTSVQATDTLINSDYLDKSQYIRDGKLDMEKVIRRFSDFMKSEYRKEDGTFIERQGRLLFLAFLRPIINGTGHYAVEPQTRQNMRMDIQVFYGNESFIIELKLWKGSAYEKKGYDQLADYLDANDMKRGYLISFCRNPQKTARHSVFCHRGHEICESIIECG